MKNIILAIVTIILVVSVHAQNQNRIAPSYENALLFQQAKFKPHRYNVAPEQPKINMNKRAESLIWSNDFSVPADWTVGQGASNEMGTWAIGTAHPGLIYYMGDITSATKSNGYAHFNGVQYLANGIFPAHEAWIKFNNPINLTDYPGVEIRFTQQYRAFNFDKTYVEISTDNINWNSIHINKKVGVNAYGTASMFVNISAYAGGQSTVYIRFKLTSENVPSYGGAYGWMIDDVALYTVEDNDMVLEQFYTQFGMWGHFSEIPKGHTAQNLSVTADVLNNGANTSYNTQLRLNISTINNTPLFNNTSTGVTINAGVADSLIMTEVQAYYPIINEYDTLICEVSVESDSVDNKLSNNTDYFNVLITDGDLARYVDVNTIESPIGWANDENGHAIGVVYGNLFTDTLSSISAFIYEANVGVSIIGKVWQFNFGTNRYVEILSTDEHIFESDIVEEWIKLPFNIFDISEAIVNEAQLLFGFEVHGWKYSATNDSLNFTCQFGADNSLMHDPLFSARLKQENETYNLPVVPAFVLHFKSKFVGIEQIDFQSQVKLFPNPATNMVQIYNAPQADVVFYDIMGKEVLRRKNISDTEMIDIKKLTEGNYIVKITKGNNTATYKVAVVR